MTQQQSIFIEDSPEQGFIEYKTAEKGNLPNDLWEVVTGYANAEGGKVDFGVRPDGTHVGLSSGDIDKLQRDLQSDLSGGYSFRIHPTISVQGDLVTLYVPAAPAAVRPVYSLKRGLPNGARVRVGSSNEKVDDEWMRRFSVAAMGGAELLWSDVTAHEVLDRQQIEEYIARLNIKRGNAYVNYSYGEILKKLNITNKKEQVSLFGLLAFSKDVVLQDTISPTVNIAITQYSGIAKVSNDGSQAFIENKEFFGSVTKQFTGALDHLLNMMPIRGTINVKTGIRKDEYSVPALAIREALANTVAHRDYSVHSSRVQIDVYADRIEFINPGASLVPLSELEKTPSVTRNPLLMAYMREMGLTEQLARGIRTIKYELRAAGLKEPIFANIGNSFLATIYRSAFLSDADKHWLERFSSLKLNERQMNCVLALRTSADGTNNAEYRERNGLNQMGNDKKANKELKRLVDKGVLEKEGINKSTRYYLTPKYK